jgi:hypothetical protein
MKRSIKDYFVFIIAVGFSQRITNKTDSALAQTRHLIFI